MLRWTLTASKKIRCAKSPRFFRAKDSTDSHISTIIETPTPRTVAMSAIPTTTSTHHHHHCYSYSRVSVTPKSLFSYSQIAHHFNHILKRQKVLYGLWDYHCKISNESAENWLFTWQFCGVTMACNRWKSQIGKSRSQNKINHAINCLLIRLQMHCTYTQEAPQWVVWEKKLDKYEPS